MIEIHACAQSIGEEEHAAAGVKGDRCFADSLQAIDNLSLNMPGVVIVRVDLNARTLLVGIVGRIALEGMLTVVTWAMEALAIAEVAALDQDSKTVPTRWTSGSANLHTSGHQLVPRGKRTNHIVAWWDSAV